MLLKKDGKSENCAHLYTYTGALNCLFRLFSDSLQTLATYSELPSNTTGERDREWQSLLKKESEIKKVA